jgi:predicted 3-demethylubiquinone-9 3-methyltransferase (glyoxalase superfamily)
VNKYFEITLDNYEQLFRIQQLCINNYIDIDTTSKVESITYYPEGQAEVTKKETMHTCSINVDDIHGLSDLLLFDAGIRNDLNMVSNIIKKLLELTFDKEV